MRTRDHPAQSVLIQIKGAPSARSGKPHLADPALPNPKGLDEVDFIVL